MSFLDGTNLDLLYKLRIVILENIDIFLITDLYEKIL